VDGYETILVVKHEKQRQAKDLVVSLGGPAATWHDVSGDYEIAQDVVLSVEKALGQEPEAVQIGNKPPTSSRPIEVWDCIVAQDAARRINDLKSRRRDLVTEVKAMDQQILKAVYDGTYEQVKPDIERTKQRKATMEQQITEIDKEILALVVAD
jgi:peptidoglycan hydrolase CwlO-like protein